MDVLSACVLDGAGGTLDATAEEIRAGRSERGAMWLHIDIEDVPSVSWLHTDSGLDSIVLEALLAHDPRPRSAVVQDGLMLILRAINVNEGQERDDMVALRLWFDSERILTMRRRKVAAIQDILGLLASGSGPRSVAGLLHEVTDHLLHRIGLDVIALEDQVDAIEEEILTLESREIRPRIAEIRRTAIELRRYLAPQRETIGRLHAERLTWLTDTDRAHLREAADRVTRYMETLDSARDRAAVSYEELTGRLAEQMNQTMYLLSVVAAIFLPLGLLTGLLGINVGGMPGTDSPSAFALVCVVMLLLGIGEYLIFRRMKMI